VTGGDRGRVLLVDDDPALLEIMAEVLQEAGFTVEDGERRRCRPWPASRPPSPKSWWPTSRWAS
jgi:hypothetical protein